MCALNVKKSIRKGINRMLNPLKTLDMEWQELKFGIEKAKHNYHTFIFSTIRNGKPESRTVVLRELNQNKPQIWFHTDIRSQKISEIERHKNVSALFYDKSRKIQLRINGVAYLESDKRTNVKIWNTMSSDSKLCYMSPYAPSQKIPRFTPNLIGKPTQEINEKDDELGLSRFCRVKINIDTIDWLRLDYQGHQRLKFHFNKAIKFEWIAS